MELNNNVKLLLKKRMIKEVPCFSFRNDLINRNLAIHVNVDNDKQTSVTDVATGLRLFSLEIPINLVKEDQIEEKLNWFIKHYSLEAIQKQFKDFEESIKNETKKE